MPTETAQTVAARTEQSKAAKRATLDLLKAKKRASKELTLLIPTEDGDQEATFELQAVSGHRYDALMTASPATLEQKADGVGYDINTFAPKLLSEVVVDPEISEAEWKAIWHSPNWGAGELRTLYTEAVTLCARGLDLGPTVTG